MKPTTLGAQVLALLAAAGPAGAHITIADPTAASGGYHAAFFNVSHGCGASPTVALRIEIPAGVASAHPQPKPGWTLEIETRPLDKPVRADGADTTSRVSAITWRGKLDAAQFDQFGAMLKLPTQTGPLYFPAVQTCEMGESRWVEIPAPGAAWTSVAHPAPVLTLSAAEAPEHDHEAMMRAPGVASPAPTKPAPVKTRPAATRAVSVVSAWSRPTPPGAPTGAGYMTLVNTGGVDRLVGASSPASRTVEIHEMSVTNGVMRMRPVVGGLPVPAGGRVSLAPGGYHLMLIGLKRALKAGDRIPVTLRFERAGAVGATLTVGAQPEAK